MRMRIMKQTKCPIGHRLVYCKDCHSRDSWQRDPVRDIHGADTGKVLWYKCKVCRHTTIIPAELDYKDSSNAGGLVICH